MFPISDQRPIDDKNNESREERKEKQVSRIERVDTQVANMTNQTKERDQKLRLRRLLQVTSLIALSAILTTHNQILASAQAQQATKSSSNQRQAATTTTGAHSQNYNNNNHHRASGQASRSPVGQLQPQATRDSNDEYQQQRVQNQAALESPAAVNLQNQAAHPRRKATAVEQQQVDGAPGDDSYGAPNSHSSSGDINQNQAAASTEDPLADSEPALYGSVAGAPGVDFPAYTRIPKTSFTCEGKNFDFGFYADEEAQCQVYHVCWSGRRESFLCGVGTVFNQAILACDYWHSVDCSKSSQFWGINSELGRASPEPTANRPASGVRLPAAQSNAASPSGNSVSTQFQSPASIGNQRGLRSQHAASNQSPSYGQENNQQQRPSVNSNQQEQQPTSVDPLDLVVQQKQQHQQQSDYSQRSSDSFAAQRREPVGGQQKRGQQQADANNQYSNPSSTPVYQSESAIANQAGVKGSSAGGQRGGNGGAYAAQLPVASTPSSTLNGKRRTSGAGNANSDLSLSQMKVSSLIESPVRAPLSAASKATQNQSLRRAKPPGQLAVARAQQAGSQTLNSGPSRRASQASVAGKQARKQQAAQPAPVAQQQQQSTSANYEPDNNNIVDEPQQQQLNSPVNQYQQQQAGLVAQQQLQSFDDSPAQTSGSYEGARNANAGAPNNRFVSSQQMIIHAGANSPDGSSAITSQYDTYNGQQELHNYNQPQLQAPQQQTQLTSADQPNEPSASISSQVGPPAASSSSALADDTGARANVNPDDDFRSSGARAAASNKQNWYIMRSL